MIDLSNTVITLKNHNHIDSLFYSINLNNHNGSTANQPASNKDQQQQKLESKMPNIFLSSNSNGCNGKNDYLEYSNNTNNAYSNDANKAFDDVVFDILKVDPNDIAGQLTLIDVPLFKAIEPDELISCKWMSREKLIKAPNIVHFTRRFNQTTFWCQKEILNCKRIEKRGNMITHFIKIAKRLNVLHSFNSLMAIIVALKSAPIYRLKKTWSQHVSRRDITQFDRLADLMFDTSDNKRKIRDMHMNCKLPCIPFLGLFLTDLIHIDIAHPHNSFDNPQRRNQMNNICRLISEYQQSNYQDLTSHSCLCCFNINTINTSSSLGVNNNTNNNNNSSLACNLVNGVNNLNNVNSNLVDSEMSIDHNILSHHIKENDDNNNDSNCLISNCQCAIHHGNEYGGGIINSDGTMYISEIKYVQNYLNSFLYIEELQKFKEDENYRDSLELEPDPPSANSNLLHQQQQQQNLENLKNLGGDLSLTPSNIKSSSVSSPNKLFLLSNNNPNSKTLTSYTSAVVTDSSANNHVNNYLNNQQQHRKTLSLATSLFNNTTTTQTESNNINNNNNNNNLINETQEFINDFKQHPLDDSVILNDNHHHHLTQTVIKNAQQQNQSSSSSSSVIVAENNHNNHNTHSNQTETSSTILNELPNLNLNLNLSKEQQKRLLNSVKLNDPPSLLKELLKHRHNSLVVQSPSSQQQQPAHNGSNNHNHHHHHHHHHHSIKNKFNCYSANSGDIDDDDDEDGDDVKDEHVNKKNDKTLASNNQTSPNNLKNIPVNKSTTTTATTTQSTRRLSGRNLAKCLDEVNGGALDCLDSNDVTMSQQHQQSANETNNHNLILINNFIQTSLIQFESPIKRKCIIKSFRKPRFSQWKSYWLQLVGGNLLIYYPSKTIYFSRTSNTMSTSSMDSSGDFSRRSSTGSNYTSNEQANNFIPQQPNIQEESLATTTANNNNNNNNNNLTNVVRQNQELQMQHQCRKIFYHKNPCKMHPIANWMVVSLFQDKENEILAAQAANNLKLANIHTKFDIQLNDLNNGNMYKYRFDSLPLAKEWLEQFKLASNYHERQKPDNLIRFD